MVLIDVRLVDLQATLLDMKTSYLTTNWCLDLVARTFQSKHFSFLREDSKNHCVELPLPPLFSICKWDIKGLFTFLATHLEGMFHFQHINFECQMHHKHWKKSTKWDTHPRFVLWKDFVCVQHLSNVEVILSQDGLNWQLRPAWPLQHQMIEQ
jgi:hypothetical protein